MIEVGSVVKLKSGSPFMCVKEINDDKVVCSWISDDCILSEWEFTIKQLYLIWKDILKIMVIKKH